MINYRAVSGGGFEKGEADGAYTSLRPTSGAALAWGALGRGSPIEKR